jgi:hypothetical protein
MPAITRLIAASSVPVRAAVQLLLADVAKQLVSK